MRPRDRKIERLASARLFGRELQKWEPDGDEGALEDLSIDSTPRGKGGRWDQFEANRRQFGVRTSFNEDVSSGNPLHYQMTAFS